MIKPGVYKELSFNQTFFCFEINPPDYITVWREDANGKETDNGWWRMEITSKKFHWLVDQWNNGNIKKVYPHWWEQPDSRKEHINNLLQLNHEELTEVFNYYAYVIPQREWCCSDVNFMREDYRPIWQNHKVIGYTIMSRERADEYNGQPDAQTYYGLTMEEWVERNLKGA